MYPQTLLNLSRRSRITVTLKSDVIIQGYLGKCDVAMNMHLKGVQIKTPGGSIVRAKEVYLRGLGIRFINVDPLLLEKQSLFD